jgi:hypothetical protein
MKEANEAKPREPLATPFEAAQLAVSLAIMTGSQTPDLKGAVALLREAAFKVQDLIKPRIHYPDSVMAETMEQALAVRPHDSVKPMSPATHPKEAAELLKHSKTFPGAEKIKPPKMYPASSRTCWQAVLGGNPSNKDIQTAKAKVLKTQPGLNDCLNFGMSDERSFWNWASIIAPNLPRFSKLYTTPRPQKKRSKQGQARGRYMAPKQAETGKFRKSSGD